MIPYKPNLRRPTLFVLSIFIFSTLKIAAQGDAAAGKALFSIKCASCHAVNSKVVGPALKDVESRWPSTDLLKKWIVNWKEAVATGDAYPVEMQNFAATPMQEFPELRGKETDLNNLLAYIRDAGKAAPPPAPGTEEPKGDGQGAIIFGIISIILAIVALILMQVNSNLKKLSDDKEGIHRPEPVAFYKNKFYIALGAVIFFVIGGYFIAKGAIGLGRQKDMQPVQPIYYSHKVHAGLNQINCLYCHGGAMEGKQASIPSVNVCMNCHKQISEYKGPKIFDASGNEINGTAEINKLYEYAGVDPKNPGAFDPSKAKSIPWTRIHNLPDHAYFNHSQHVNAGKQQCQSCHGEITDMHEVKQFAELSMSWCINCHRQTNVNFNYDSTKGNKFYSIYEKFHRDIEAGKMDSVKVEHIGGLECQKCHY
ncbi:MAG: c-type cytochrome [Bacteroidetes bacterium]|nr:MAG: c-type cytochrome [Bacteroidota bacterium]